MSVISENFGNSLSLFAQDYYKEVVQDNPDQNAVISPIVLQIVLTLALFGALGETASQLKKSLRFEKLTPPEITQQISDLAKKLKNTGGVRRANKLYVDSKFPVLEEFRRIIKKVENVNFGDDKKAREKMNNFVEKQTENTIKDLFPLPLDEDTKLVLISTIYFKASWVNDFDFSFNNTFWTNKEDSATIEFMKTKKANYYNFGELPDLKASAIELKYKNTDVSMVIVVPNDNDGLVELEGKLAKVEIKDILSQMTETELEVSMPKFKIETTVQLNDILQRLGLERMFSDEAEFGKISKQPLSVSKVVQKTFINVDTKGTEAGAATYMGFQSRMGSFNEIFNIDNSFVFYLKDASNTILFMGRFLGK